MLAIAAGTVGAAALDLRGHVTPRGAALVLLAGWVPAVALDTPLGIAAAWAAIVALHAAGRWPAGALRPARAAD
jgi:hypothetical protein